MIRRIAAAIATAVPLLAAAAWPEKPIKVLIGYAPGGSTDVVARMIAPKLQEKLGQPIVIENKPGGAGDFAAELMLQSPPDGYTLMMSTVALHAINPGMLKQKFHPLDDFTPIAFVCSYPMILIGSPQTTFRNVEELKEQAAKRGLPVIGHVPRSTPYLEARLDDVQHLTGVARADGDTRPFPDVLDGWTSFDDAQMAALARAIADAGIANTPTMVVIDRVAAAREPERATAERDVHLLPRLYRDAVWSRAGAFRRRSASFPGASVRARARAAPARSCGSRRRPGGGGLVGDRGAPAALSERPPARGARGAAREGAHEPGPRGGSPARGRTFQVRVPAQRAVVQHRADRQTRAMTAPRRATPPPPGRSSARGRSAAPRVDPRSRRGPAPTASDRRPAPTRPATCRGRRRRAAPRPARRSAVPARTPARRSRRPATRRTCAAARRAAPASRGGRTPSAAPRPRRPPPAPARE